MFDVGLSLPQSLLGEGLDLFFQHLRGLGAGFRVMAQFLGGANHESAKKIHLRANLTLSCFHEVEVDSHLRLKFHFQEET